jgi:glycosyltransferase involved in cell wall biosynthesis
MDQDIFVIVTAYNEAEQIGATLTGLASAFPGRPVFLADDGSSDPTAEIGRAAGARVLRSERVIGKGGAATLAARAALRRTSVDADRGVDRGAERDADFDMRAGERGSIFVFCDGDLGESASELRALARAVEAGEADVAVAAFSRRLGGGLGLARGFARWAIRRRCGLSTVAPISGQRALSAAALRDVLPFAHGFGMELGMTIDAVLAGHRVVEIELDLSHRASGRTPSGFVHRAGQLVDFVRAYLARGRLAHR